MQNYIESHRNEEITFADLSKASMYSPWYSRRLFLELLGVTPADYVRKLKLRDAALRLRDEKTKVIDVAFDCGFSSVDGFQRAFYKEFGCNPKEYALNPVPLPLFTPYGVKYQPKGDYKKMNAKNVFITVVEKPARKIILKRGIKATHYFEYCQEVGCDVWGTLLSIKSLTKEPVCLWLPKKPHQGRHQRIRPRNRSRPRLQRPDPRGF